MTRRPEFDVARFPHLREFARGYLHQDMIPEHGSPIIAARAYVADLSPGDRKQTAAEAAKLREAIAGMTIDDINLLFAKLGAAVKFRAEEDVKQTLDVLI